MGFQFDSNNFLLGLLAGWGSSYLIYRSRGVLGSLRQGVTDRTKEVGEFAGGRVTGKYLERLTAHCQYDHLLGDFATLKDIIVEPRFIPPPAFAEPPDEEEVITDVFHVVPRVHDFPHLYAPYNIETLSIHDLSFGHRAVALLGQPGSGRTTALQAIALWALGELDFVPERDAITEQMEAEEKSLRAEDRAKRIKERVLIEERAKERMAAEKGQPMGQGGSSYAGVSPFKRMMPLYIHMQNVIPESGEYGTNIDPAEPLMRALQHHIGKNTLSITIPRDVYSLIEEGSALILLDGFDELTEAEQARRLPWLSAFTRTYDKNFTIITSGVNGYGGLVRAGFLPVYLRAWSDSMIRRLINRWGAVYPEAAHKRRLTSQVDDAILTTLKETTRGLTPFDITLKLRAVFAGQETDGEDLIHYLKTYLDEVRDVNGEAIPSLLAKLAEIQLDHGAITQKHLIDLALGKAIAKAPDVQPEEADAVFTPTEADAGENLDALFGGEEPPLDDIAAPAESAEAITDESAAPAAPAPTPAPDALPADIDRKTLKKLLKQQLKTMNELIDKGLVVSLRGGRFMLRHSLIAAYFASQTLAEADEQTLAERALQPAWSHAIGYAANSINLEPAVRAHAARHPDVLYQHMLNVTQWLRYSNEPAPWRTELMRYLGGLFAAPNQYPLLRERIASALVGTRDYGVVSLFDRNLQNANPDVRRLSALALGALRNDDAVGSISALLKDEIDVALAATLSLGAINTGTAFETIVELIANAPEAIRQAVAESLAEDPNDGYAVLHEAIGSQDMLVRRAAVWGLRRVSAPWALIEIYRTFLEDAQWYVRSAAQQAFTDLQVHEASKMLQPYPSPENLTWLREWLTQQGPEAAALNPDDALLHVLQEGDDLMKTVSAQAVGQLGMADRVLYLYDALTYPAAPLRDSAHRALAQLEAQLGEPLPAPA